MISDEKPTLSLAGAEEEVKTEMGEQKAELRLGQMKQWTMKNRMYIKEPDTTQLAGAEE